MAEYTIYGHGKKHVLALHGWLGDSTIFTPMLPAIDPSTTTFAFMDYRGYGKSHALSGQYTVEEIVSDAIALADTLGWSCFHLLSHSMGGKAALRLATSYPDRVDRIVATTPVGASPVHFDANGLALFEGAASSIDNRQTIIDATTGSRLPHAWTRALAEASWHNSSKEAFSGYFNSWAKSGFAAEARGLTTPILALAGEHDAGVTVDTVRATYLADYPNAELRVLPNAGHYPMQETPISYAAEVLRFLAED